MNQGMSVVLVLALALVAANLPFFSPRLLIVGPRRPGRALGWRLVEMLLLGGLVLALGMALEARIGQHYPQGWAFYAAFACLFITAGFPGFVWRYLRKGAQDG
jgi:Protein of unknown function (DUF2818)